MNAKYKLTLLWILVLAFLAAFTYGLATGQFSPQFMGGVGFGIAIMSMAHRLEKYRQRLVSGIKKKPLAANPADYGLTWYDIVQAASKTKRID